MASQTVRVEGLREVNRALSRLNKNAAKAVRDELKAAGEPVRREAESMAVAHIRRIGPEWSKVRLGATSRDVYIAPRRRRGRGSSRPNLAILLMERAFKPAARLHEREIVMRVGQALDRLIGRAGF